MPDTIPTIDAWNARLFPPGVVDSDSTDSTWAEPGDCGCCEMPKCCPPLLECQSYVFTAIKAGFINDGTSDDLSGSDGLNDDLQTRYKRIVNHYTWLPKTSETSTTYGIYGSGGTVEGPSYDTVSCTGSIALLLIGEVSDLIEKHVEGLGSCFSNSPITAEYKCDGGGAMTQTEKAGTQFSGELHVWTASTTEFTTVDVGGDPNPAHATWVTDYAAWEAAHPGLQAAHDAWQIDHDAWQVEYDTWLAEWWVWHDAGEIGDPPADPREEPAEPDLPGAPVEPPENYPPCWFKTTIVTHRYEIDPTSETFATREQDGSPTTVEEFHNTDTPSVPSLSEMTSSVSYEEPMTHAAFLAAADAWISGYTWPSDQASDSDFCEPAANCSATGEYFSLRVVRQKFRYRWKLNKCCGLYAGLTWLEVLFSKAFLAWLAIAHSDSTDSPPPDTPTSESMAWEHESASRPTECDNSDSTDGVIGPADSGWDPFDDETRWSPWSLVVEVPAGQEGTIMLRSLYLACYRSVYGTKPDYIPLYGKYDPSDLDENGIPDAAE